MKSACASDLKTAREAMSREPEQALRPGGPAVGGAIENASTRYEEPGLT